MFASTSTSPLASTIATVIEIKNNELMITVIIMKINNIANVLDIFRLEVRYPRGL
jgi:hypothetical protein